MYAPMSESFAMLFKWPLCRGVSRTISTSLRFSLSTTSALRLIRLLVTPVAISDIVRIEHGAIIMPSVLYDPLEQAAAISSNLWLSSANSLIWSNL